MLPNFAFNVNVRRYILLLPPEALRGWRLWTLDIAGGAAMYGVGAAFAFVPLLPLLQETAGWLPLVHFTSQLSLSHFCHFNHPSYPTKGVYVELKSRP
jgi:hypothetical protein